MGGILGSGSSAKQPAVAGSLQFSSAQRGGSIPLVYGTTRVAGYNRVAGTNAISGDTEENGVTLLPRAITFSAGAGSTGLVIQGALTSTRPFRSGNIARLTGWNAGASRTIDGFTGGQTVSVELAFLSPI